ncbi:MULTISPECIES: universal stress protein [unclassified Algibacter]|uniref:universal stress protein n=1 Tax=unclassified Algibacter TaxID=2615009 RepID=UPI00131EB0E7|nr:MULTISPECIES: universal stress protein [unclassified Algibacter]MCL5128785.1 universal stress protein [Algibacter sp. L4_22]
MKNILIPTDFSENAWNAIEYALRFFSKSACNFYILHVDTSDDSRFHEKVPAVGGTKVSSIVKSPSKKLLQQTIKRIIKSPYLNSNHRFYPVMDNNYIINSIRKQVAEKKIDFIVMGTRGESGLNNLAVGRNTGNVITKVKCTTLVVPENAKYVNMKEIAFPTDFSFFYHAETLQPMADIVEGNHAAVRALHINKNKADLNEDQKKNKEFLDDYFNNQEHSFHFLTNNDIEDAVQGFVENKQIDLIAMLAKNLNYFQKILFNPTTPKISYYTDVPFLVLH